MSVWNRSAGKACGQTVTDRDLGESALHPRSRLRNERFVVDDGVYRLGSHREEHESSRDVVHPTAAVIILIFLSRMSLKCRSSGWSEIMRQHGTRWWTLPWR